MYVGANMPYEGMSNGSFNRCWDYLEKMKADEILFLSHTPEADIIPIIESIKPKIVHVRAKTGPRNKGYYPPHILDYAEWDGERTLRQTCQTLLGMGITPHVILGNEPDIEMATYPDDSGMWRRNAKKYRDWYIDEAVNIKAAFGDKVKLSPAPLSQGNHDRFLVWFSILNPIYSGTLCQFIAEHLYDGTPWEQWTGRYRMFLPFLLPVDITEFDDNGNGRDSQFYRMVAEAFEGEGKIRSISFFTLEGGVNTRNNCPPWWFITEEEAIQIGLRGQKVEEKPMTIHDAFGILWKANGDFAYWTGSDFTGIFKVWSRSPETYGSPITGEITTDDGRVVVVFARGVWEWKGGDLVKVESGL